MVITVASTARSNISMVAMAESSLSAAILPLDIGLASSDSSFTTSPEPRITA
jgi:hypothetical protein